jgi:pentatricopeptide repeat protein
VGIYRAAISSARSARNFTHALRVFADLSAENGFTPDECEAMQCALGFACSTLKKV